MMRRRGILIGIGILALATVSLAATVQVYFFQLPDPAEADGRGIIRWMILRDLSQEEPEIRRSLLLRIFEVLDGKKLEGGGSINDQLDPKYQPRFWSNVDVLLEEWFHFQSERYAAADKTERIAILDEILDEGKGLTEFRQDSPTTNSETEVGATGSPQPAKDPITAAAEFIQKMNLWIEKAPPEKQQQLRQFAAALQARMAYRSLQGLMNAFQGDKPAEAQ